jgi:hypothetical protein
MNKCEINRLVNLPGLAICITFGTFTLYVHNSLLPLIYAVFSVSVIFAQGKDDDILASLWLLVALFPVPFLLYYEDYLLAAVFIVHNRTIRYRAIYGCTHQPENCGL